MQEMDCALLRFHGLNKMPKWSAFNNETSDEEFCYGQQKNKVLISRPF